MKALMEEEPVKSKSFLQVYRGGSFCSRYSERDKALVFALSGGIADYLARFDDGKPLEENIIELFLSTNGRLYEEPSNLLKQEFRDPGRYNDILYLLSTGTSRVSDLANKLGVQSGSLNPYLNNLIDLGIIERKTPVLDRKTKRPVYAVSDTMFQFWHAFVQPNLSLINLGLGKKVYRQRIEPRINEYMGKVFEKICLQYYDDRDSKTTGFLFCRKIMETGGAMIPCESRNPRSISYPSMRRRCCSSSASGEMRRLTGRCWQSLSRNQRCSRPVGSSIGSFPCRGFMMSSIH